MTVKLSFYKFDESNVKEFSMDIFNGGLYPTQELFKYPKTGEDNSKVTLHLYDLELIKQLMFFLRKIMNTILG